MSDGPVYALNLFDIADAAEYREYARRSVEAVRQHGGRVVALGGFGSNVVGELAARETLILVEWESRAAFQGYLDDPELADLHPHREAGSANYVWQLFDKLSDLRPLLSR